jgi:hypothetical protein
MDHKQNYDILKWLKTASTLEEIVPYVTKCIQRVDRMQRNELKKILRNFRPYGSRNLGSSLKRQLGE